MTARALIKSPTAQRSSPSSTSPGGSTPQLPNQSVQADGMRDRLPSGSTTNNNGTPCRVSPLITARRHPSKGCRLRVMTTEVGKSWEWVVCGVFVRQHRPFALDAGCPKTRNVPLGAALYPGECIWNSAATLAGFCVSGEMDSAGSRYSRRGMFWIALSNAGTVWTTLALAMRRCMTFMRFWR